MISQRNSLLKPLSCLYGALTRLERGFFTVFPFLQHHPDVPVISIGNLTMGGTGKTPLLLEILEILTKAGKRPAVISRGYRSPWERSFFLLLGPGPHPEGITDEALLVNQRFPTVPVFLGKNRAHSVRIAESCYHPDVILLDDGFQYRRLHRHSARDKDFILWDAGVDPAQEELIPAGTMREPFSRLADAHLIILTRCEAVSLERQAGLRQTLSAIAGGRPTIGLNTQPCGWSNGGGNLLPLDSGPKRVVAFAAIGNPGSFRRQLEQAGTTILDAVWYRDHHHFTPTDLRTLAARAETLQADLVCTEKDRVKLPPDWLATQSVFALHIRLRPAATDAPLAQLLGLPIP
jgi:tetraacyldisaccharide 4'-kinase